MGKIVPVLVFTPHAVTAKIGNADFFSVFLRSRDKSHTSTQAAVPANPACHE